MRGLVDPVSGGLDFDGRGCFGCRFVSSRRLLGRCFRMGLEGAPLLGGLGRSSNFLK